MNSYQRLKALVCDIEDVMDNIFTSGFATIGSHTLEKVRCIAGECSNSGLDFAAAALSGLAEKINEKRHAITFDFSDMAEGYCILNQYIIIIKSKIEFLIAEEFIRINTFLSE